MEVATGQKKQQLSGGAGGGGDDEDPESKAETCQSEGGPSSSSGPSGSRRSSARRLSEPSADEADLALLSPEERENRRKFEQKRKAHYVSKTRHSILQAFFRLWQDDSDD